MLIAVAADNVDRCGWLRPTGDELPRLAGQHEAYTFKALQDYRTGDRVGTQAAMAEAVRGLTDADFADLAYFLARVQP